MTFNQTYAMIIAFCGGVEIFRDSALGLILVVLSLIYWELVKDDN